MATKKKTGKKNTPAKKTAPAKAKKPKLKKAAPKKKAPPKKKAAPQKKAAPKKKAAPQKKAAPKKAVKAKAAPKKAVKAKAAPKKAVKAKAAPKKAVKAKAAPKKAVKAKAAPTKAVKAKAAPKAKPKPVAKTPISRRDGAGHLDPQYEADLMAMSHKKERGEPERAFVVGGLTDDLAESLGEQVVSQATSGEYDGEDVLDQEVTEEIGGPFVESTGGREFAHDFDASNPRGADREPFPKT